MQVSRGFCLRDLPDGCRGGQFEWIGQVSQHVPAPREQFVLGKQMLESLARPSFSNLGYRIDRYAHDSYTSSLGGAAKAHTSFLPILLKNSILFCACFCTV
jgi:hypothetical protein